VTKTQQGSSQRDSSQRDSSQRDSSQRDSSQRDSSQRDSSRRDRAEAAFGHVQTAASEMIAAAHDALELVEQVVSTAGLGVVLDAFDHLSRSLFGRAHPPGDDKSSGADEAPPPQRPASPVQRISVR
jgi:cobalamin biosynthesis protein CobT